ncbi:MAG: hypothetical protein KKF46_00170 [Nanoarchaeota archaeon]|nr:hypothetical protein [Nanoarchaeota archaeon]MBU1320748.1 hypothetical protein [Nanoarchaeota archaeon]MBU1597807.1 hypothetical protein [Nanoarchaeota archaeon]MBU2441495.1 hypothetical protein [Nanoarchaeota archaeon]
MKLRLLIKKLYLDDSKFLDSKLIKEYCKAINLDYNVAIKYLTSRKYLVRILKGTFYKLSMEERKFNKININHLEAITESLRMKNITNWYFGLETANKFNNLTHEYYAIEYVINDKIFRAEPIAILGHKVRFIKLKENLFSFGIKNHNKMRISDNEKTLLDTIYLARYDGLSDKEIKNKIAGMIRYCSKEKLFKYAKEYNSAVKNFVRELF